MPLLDIATAQPYLFSIRSQSLYHNHHAATFIIGNESATARWRHLSIPYKPQNNDMWWRRRHCGGFVVRAIATIGPTRLVHDDRNVPLGVDSTSSPPTATENSEDDDDEEKVDEKELLRRKRISIANSGKKPWNCGRKHSPETLARIRERTRIAMQNPKIRKKLQTLGRAQSKETRVKIADSVRKTYHKRHEKLMLLESCRFEWENLVAEASRKGFLGEEELQWNSYKILEEQIEQEWLDTVEQRKSLLSATRGNKRAPKSPEQRRRISEAIAAKWADPDYRNRVSSGMTKFYDSHGRVQTSRRKAPSVEKPKIRIPAKKTKPATNLIDMQKRPKFKISKGPSYKDPLASSKLEMLKNIRAQRAAAESAKSEAITRAKLLIAEAQKAAQALEIAAASSPLAQASLIETRKLIAEAMQSIGSVDTEYPHSVQIDESSSFTSPEPLNHVEHEPDLELEPSTNTSHEKVNGFRTLDSSDSNFLDYDFSNVRQDLHDSLDNDDDDDDGDLQPSSYDLAYVNGNTQLHPPGSNDFEFAKLELEHMITHASVTKQLGDFISHGTDQTETGEVISQRFRNIEPDGDGEQESMLPHHPRNFDSEKEKKQLKPPTKTKKWVRGKLVEVEGD